MTIKWVKIDPLVMNGEPFCYGSRLTVRQLLELRSNGFDLPRLIKDHPELKRVGIAAAYTYAADHRDRYTEFFEADGSLAGPRDQAGRHAPRRLTADRCRTSAPQRSCSSRSTSWSSWRSSPFRSSSSARCASAAASSIGSNAA